MYQICLVVLQQYTAALEQIQYSFFEWCILHICIYVITRWKKEFVFVSVFLSNHVEAKLRHTLQTQLPAHYPGIAPQWYLQFIMICRVSFSGHQEVSWKPGNNATEVTWMLYTCSFRFQSTVLYNLLYANTLPTHSFHRSWLENSHVFSPTGSTLVPECV